MIKDNRRAATVAQNVEPLVDGFGRVHTNLRVSVTDRCNLRCFYCMPADHAEFMERAELLSFEEIERFVRIAIGLGVDRIRLTGGEPLVRRDMHKLVAKLAPLPGVQDIGLTTNGILLAQQAQALWDAGLRRLNVSLDALSAEKFKQITRREGYESVLAGIAEAQRVGFSPVKVNAVSVRGLTEEEIVPFGHLARDGRGNAVYRVHAARRRLRLAAGESALRPRDHGDARPGDHAAGALGATGQDAPASEFVFADGVGRVGFIASVSQPFCMNCNRFRITADGKLRNCLFSLEETDIRGLLRGDGTDDEIAQAVRSSIADKKEGHEINTARFIQPLRPMYSIGG